MNLIFDRFQSEHYIQPLCSWFRVWFRVRGSGLELGVHVLGFLQCLVQGFCGFRNNISERVYSSRVYFPSGFEVQGSGFLG